MVISVVGQTDKRPVIYPLLKLFQNLGDVLLVTADRHYKRLIPGYADIGHYQNILIAVTDASEDELFAEINHTPEDFEHIIFDSIDIIPDNADLVIYVGGAAPMSEDEEILLELYPDYKTINLGFGNKSIPYTVDMFKAIEQTEALGTFVPVNAQIAARLGTFLQDFLKIPAKNIAKVVMSK